MQLPDAGAARRIIPPGWALLWSGAQAGLTALAGGRRRFPGQAAVAGTLAAGGLALGVVALRLFDRAGTTSMPHEPSEATTLVTDGVYAYTRNPMYCSILLMLLANAVWSGRLRTLVALPGLMLTLQPQIEAEEDALATLFGDDYAAYKSRVPRWY
ncbi:MAG TPA: isoprenylcysteine carboxylmethyltransferase family protein [Micropruina sp.]|nr:isoprenylcysteine carboxylmethyltransferase family protein [Micropruina sp.]HMR23413.1 isoprenylcysteine carboxylmethyltransferase family protein [Micropruina sp.]